MKLPHITIEYRDDEEMAPGRLSGSLIFGFGCHWAWVFLAFLNTAMLFDVPESVSIAFQTVLLLVFAITLSLYAYKLKWARQLFSTPKKRLRNRNVAAGLCTAGTLLMLACSEATALSFGIASVAGFACGVGAAVLIMSFAVSSSVCDTATVSLSSALSCLLACIIYAAIMVLIPYSHLAAAIICAALPILEAIMLKVSSKTLVDSMPFELTTMPVKIGRLTRTLGLFSLTLGLFLGASIRLSFPSHGSAILSFTQTLFSLAGPGLFVCLALIIAMLTKRKTIAYTLRAMAPLTGLALTLLVATDAAAIQPLFVALSFLPYLAMETAIWIYVTGLSQRYRISPFPLFGVSRGATALGILTVQLAFSLSPFCESLFDTPSEITVAICIVLFLLLLTVSFTPYESQVRGTLERTGCSQLFDSPLSIAEEESYNEKEREIRAAFEAKKSDQAINITEQSAEDDFVVPSSTQPKAGTDQFSNSTAEANGERMGRYKRKCAIIADTYLLSRREAEVLFLLAKGFTGKMIQERLYISEGTANTHMRHVYRKINVHSQQELIKLVDEVEVD